MKSAALGILAFMVATLPAQAESGRQRAEASIARCSMGNPSNVEQDSCLALAIKPIERDMRLALVQQVAAAQQASQRLPSAGYIAGDDARQWKSSILAAQKAWTSYVAAQCDNVEKAQSYGGSVAGYVMLTCRIRHTADRVDELE